MTSMLHVKHLESRLGERSFHYDFALEHPEIVAITGPSGSGKTTLLNLIAGFEAPLSGSILIEGKDMTGVPPGKRPLTYVFQDHNLFAHLDVHANVALGLSRSLRLLPQDEAALGEALSKVGLAGFESRMPQGLSGGERQRVAFARALVRQRPLLLLDEAFASLDEALRIEMGSLLVELQRHMKMLVLMVSHDRREVVRIADRVIDIDAGRIGYFGPTAGWPTVANSSP